jgi:hypothetical protein
MVFVAANVSGVVEVSAEGFVSVVPCSNEHIQQNSVVKAFSSENRGLGPRLTSDLEGSPAYVVVGAALRIVDYFRPESATADSSCDEFAASSPPSDGLAAAS